MKHFVFLKKKKKFSLNKRLNADCVVQPYLLGIKSLLGNSLLKLFLVVDDSLLELGKVPMVRALDWLIQAYIAFNLKGVQVVFFSHPLSIDIM